MKKILLFVLAMIAVMVGIHGRGADDVLAQKDDMPSPSIQSLEHLSNVASKINKLLPMMVDASTELMFTVPQLGELQYHYRAVNNVKGDFGSEDFSKLKSNILNMVCTNYELGKFMMSGVKVTYVYYDKNKAFTYKFSVISEDCPEKEGWTEGKEMLVDKKAQVVDACIEGVTGQGFSATKAKKFCGCSIDYFTRISKLYTADELQQIGKERGDMNFIRTDSQEKCKLLISMQ